jgi:SAM-dependent methyltransferase
MMPKFYLSTKCRFCQSTEMELVLPLAPSPVCDQYLKIKKNQEIFPLDLFLCLDCGLSQIKCVVDPGYIYKDYIYVTASSSGLVNHFKKYADDVVNRMSKFKLSSVLDIGSNEGALLKFFKDKGLTALGVEPAKEIATIANSCGIKTLAKYFNEDTAVQIKNKYGFFDIITINNLFANIDDVTEFVEAVKKILSPNGVVIIESAYLGDMMKNKMFDFIYHEHLSCISILPIEKLFNKYKMKLVDIQAVSTKGGSMRYYFSHNDSAREKTEEVDYYRSIEVQRKFNTKDAFNELNNNIVEIRNTLLTYLINNRNKKIVGYGASATSTTFIYHLGIGDYLNALVDENPEKIGTYSPGLHLKVLDPEYIYNNDINIIVIIAWRYADLIIEKHKDFNGEFIVPLPEFKIIKNN